VAQSVELVFVHNAIEFHAFQQTYRANGHSHRLADGPPLQERDFETATAQINDQAGLNGSQSGADGTKDQPRFFAGVDCFQPNTSVTKNPVHQDIAVLSFAYSAGRYGTVELNVVPPQHGPEVAKSFYGARNGAFIKLAARENVVPQANGPAFRGKFGNFSS
jgi:hypothetical protein